MRKLIINADDLGYSIDVNREIENCINLGVITSSTLMANAPEFEEGVRIAKQYSRISVGVHLNLVEFPPLTNLEVFQKHGVADSKGNFIDGAIFVRKIDKELKKAVFEEWDAQISKLEEFGIVPTHADSHQHTHSIVELQDILSKVLAKHNIVKVRRKINPSIKKMVFGKNSIKVVHDKSNAVQAPRRNVFYRRIRLLNVKFQSMMWNIKMKKSHRMTNAFFSFRDFVENRSILHLGGKHSIIELMCHPGQKSFLQETNRLMIDKSWFPNNYELVSYHNL